MRRLAVLAAAVALVSVGCAARRPQTDPVTDRARADALAAVGCYRCLEQALGIYERQLGTRRPSPALRLAAFETATLLFLRQKELGISSRSARDKARALAAMVPTTPGHASPSTVLALADLASADTASADPDESAAGNSRERRTELAKLRSALAQASLPSHLETYLSLGFDCFDPEARRRLEGEELLARFQRVPLLRYRVATCGFGPRDTFAAVRQEDARWIEMAFFEGRAAATGRRPNLRSAIDLLSEARGELPESSAILLALAHAQRGYGDLEPALTSYDGVIAMVPRNREALLGRAIALSYLERHPEVIETTTRMIEYGTWLMGDAYYWRARSRYVLKALEDAWSDAEAAVKLAPTTNVYTLAGVIAYDRKELNVAKDRFESARKADASNCTAHSYFALVNVAEDRWAVATPAFSQAMTCFVHAAAEAQRELEEIQAADYDPVFRERLAGQQRTTVEESRLKAAQAGYNAAQGLLREGRPDEALNHLRLALDHPEVRSQAETLQKLIK